MTNIRRALLAILTFIGLTGISLAVGVGVVSAHHADITGTTSCRATSASDWSVNWTLNPSEDRDQYSIDQSGWSPAGSNNWTGKTGGNYPNSTRTNTYGSGVSSTQAPTTGVNWRDGNSGGADFETNATSATVSRPPVCPVQHLPITLCHKDGQSGNYSIITVDDDSVVKESGHDGHSGDIIPAFNYTDDNGFAQTYPGKNLDKASLLRTGCVEAPQYDPLVVVTETSCETGDTQVTVTTTTTTYHAQYVNGVWVKVADTPTVVVTHRSLNENEQATCVPTHEPKVVTVDGGTPKCGDTSVATTTTTTTYTYTYEYVNDVPTWVEHTTVVVTHGSRPVETEDCVAGPVAPVVTTSTECGVKDTFTAGPTDGVVYSVTSGTLNQGQVVTIVATPADGFRFDSDLQTFTFTVTGGTVEECAVVTTVPQTTQPPVTLPPTTVPVIPEIVVLPRTGAASTGILVLACVISGIGGTMLVVRRKFRKV